MNGFKWLFTREFISKIKVLLGLASAFALLTLAYSLDPGTESGHWYSLLPPLLAIILAFYTQKLLLSLLMATVVGSFLVNFNAPHTSFLQATGESLKYIVLTPWQALTDPTNLQILAFVLLVLALITVLIFGGGLKAIVTKLQHRVRGPRSAQIMTALLGFIIFIDDYANTMIVGTTMRHLTDRYRVSREKLSFLVDATSAPVAGIAIVSTWIGYEVGLFSDISTKLNLGRDGYSIFFDVLGYRFYCLMMIIFVIYNAWSGRDFAAMARAQRRSLSTGEVLRPSAQPMTSKHWQIIEPWPQAQERVATALIPLLTLIGAVFVGLWLDGGGPSYGLSGLFAYQTWSTILSSSENGPLVLAIAALIAGLLAMVLGRALAKVPAGAVLASWFRGMKGSVLPVVVLLLAWSLKRVCDDLHTGEFIGVIVKGWVSGLWFPTMVFLISGLTAFATGTSWGTMAILLPTLVPVAYFLDGNSYGQVTAIVFAAILDGAIMGDHCSPISDTTIMSSIASGSDHMDHVRTQLPYALFVAFIAVVCGYLPAALGWPSWLSLSLAALAIIGMHHWRGRLILLDEGVEAK